MTLRERVGVRPSLAMQRPALSTPDEDAQIRQAFNSIKAWVDARPNHVMVSETVGRFVRSTSTSYYYMRDGELRYKVDAMPVEPNRAHLIFFKENNKYYAYFPETEGFVDATGIVSGYDAAMAGFHGVLSYENILFGSTISRALVEGEGTFELHVVFDAVKVGMNPPGQISMIIRANQDGRIREVEQERLGIVQKTVMTYTTFVEAEVLAAMPATPDPVATPPDGLFDEEAQKNLLHFRLLENQASTAAAASV